MNRHEVLKDTYVQEICCIPIALPNFGNFISLQVYRHTLQYSDRVSSSYPVELLKCLILSTLSPTSTQCACDDDTVVRRSYDCMIRWQSSLEIFHCSRASHIYNLGWGFIITYLIMLI